MKVLHVTNYLPGTHTHVGGAEQACFRTMQMLADHGHESIAATTPCDTLNATDAAFRVFPLPLLENYLPGPIVPYLEAVKWYSVQHDPLARRAFGRILDSERPDVVHFHNFQFLTFSLLRETARRRLPSCLSVYDYWIFCPKAQLLRPDKSFCHEGHGTHCTECLPRQFTLFQKILLSMRPAAFNRCFELVDRFLVLSKHSSGVLEEKGIPLEKIRVVPLTLPPESHDDTAEPAPVLAEKSLLFAGWLNDRKGVHIAIQAMPHILRREPGAHLYVIGGSAKFSEDYEADFRRFMDTNRLHPHVTFLGHQPPQTVLRYLRQVKVLLLPEQYANMSPLIMVEAMMIGLPVVASNLGGIPEYIEDGVTGFLAAPYDPDDFAAKACVLLSDENLRTDMSDRAKKRILESNSDDRIWEATLSTYQELMRPPA
jgi:glycosyltransferase involved in cell wall biosynthesis